MGLPGFTAEASLYNGNVRYQSTTEATCYGGLVQPAQLFSTVFHPDRPIFCLKYNCVDLPPYGKPFCFKVLGFWNPVTRSCD
jgi:hypothetical protein